MVLDADGLNGDHCLKLEGTLKRKCWLGSKVVSEKSGGVMAI